MQHNTQVPVGKHNNRQHASPHREVATDVKQMPIRPIIIIIIMKYCDSIIFPDHHMWYYLNVRFFSSYKMLWVKQYWHVDATAYIRILQVHVTKDPRHLRNSISWHFISRWKDSREEIMSSTWSVFWNRRNLTHGGRDEMDAIWQTTFSSAFSWMKIFEFRLKFHWSLFLRVQLTILQHWFR